MPGPERPLRGITWPLTSRNDRSSTETSKKIWTESFKVLDKDVAAKVEAEQKWRFAYASFIRKHVALSFKSPKAALGAAQAGLDAAHRLFEFVDADGKHMSLADAMKNVPGSFETGVIKGNKAKPTSFELEVPYDGRILKGEELLAQLEMWVSYGTIEPSAGDAIAAVVRTKKWVDLSDRYFVMLGAGSAMGPYPLLMALGANVIAVDLDRAPIWERLFKIARESCGTLYFPLNKPQSEIVDASADFAAGDKAMAPHAGANLLEVTPQIGRWIGSVLSDKPLTIGSYVYLDGEAHVRLVLACDAITATAIQTRQQPTSLAFLCTPTDVHAIPRDAYDAARSQAKAGGAAALLATVARLFSKKACVPNVQPEAVSEDGESFTYVDALVVPQGPNYALAKRMQHWRAMLSHSAGCIVSSNIAPSTKTVSVVKNRSFALAYEGVSFFKPMEIFEPATSHSVMTAILLYDLNDKTSAANAKSGKTRNPLELFAYGSFHGGVWRTAYTFDSIGAPSVVVALVKIAFPYIALLVLLIVSLKLTHVF